MRIKDHMGKTAFIEFTSKEKYATFGIFNKNAYPPQLSSIVEACSSRTAMFLFHITTINREISAVKRMFLNKSTEVFTKPWANGFIKAKVNLDVDFIVIYDGIEYLSAFNSTLHSLKSLLDIYANLIAKLILPSASLKFSKSKYKDQVISGGSIVKWLKTSVPSSFQNGAALSGIIIHHSIDWITEAVKYRDRLSHYGDIKGMQHMQVLLKRQYPPFNPSDIMPPMMPDGRLVTDYCLEMVNKLNTFMKDSLKLLPNINLKLLDFAGFVMPLS